MRNCNIFKAKSALFLILAFSATTFAQRGSAMATLQSAFQTIIGPKKLPKLVVARHTSRSENTGKRDPTHDLSAVTKPTIFVFWDMNCRPCWTLLVLLSKWSPDLTKEGIQVAPVLLANTYGHYVAAFSKFHRENPRIPKTWEGRFPEFPFYYDVKSQCGQALGIKITPTIVFVNAAGVILERQDGQKFQTLQEVLDIFKMNASSHKTDA